MRSTRTGTVLISGLMWVGIARTAQAQSAERRLWDDEERCAA